MAAKIRLHLILAEIVHYCKFFFLNNPCRRDLSQTLPSTSFTASASAAAPGRSRAGRGARPGCCSSGRPGQTCPDASPAGSARSKVRAQTRRARGVAVVTPDIHCVRLFTKIFQTFSSKRLQSAELWLILRTSFQLL